MGPLNLLLLSFVAATFQFTHYYPSCRLILTIFLSLFFHKVNIYSPFVLGCETLVAANTFKNALKASCCHIKYKTVFWSLLAHTVATCAFSFVPT